MTSAFGSWLRMGSGLCVIYTVAFILIFWVKSSKHLVTVYHCALVAPMRWEVFPAWCVPLPSAHDTALLS